MRCAHRRVKPAEEWLSEQRRRYEALAEPPMGVPNLADSPARSTGLLSAKKTRSLT